MHNNSLSLGSGTPSMIRQHYYSRKVKMTVAGLVLLVLCMGYYGTERYLEYSQKIDIAAQSQTFLDDLQKTQQAERAFTLKTQEASQDAALKSDQELTSVFPAEADYTSLTRLLDDFFKKNNTSKNPIIATDLQFDQPAEDDKKQFTILPFSMNIESSEENFYRFLAFAESSGTLKGKIRLMDIQSIQLNFPTEEEQTLKKSIRFNVKMSAYSQKNNNQ
ncbi:MAG: hypothetical protein AAB551_01605 [Patescibacteria group bacterium]